MTSPSAAHTGIVHARPPVDYGTNTNPSPQAQEALAAAAMLAAPTPAELTAYAETLVDAGHASWCPSCGGTGVLARWGTDRPTTCTRCRGGRLNPFHGCTFQSTPPCACTDRCQAYRPPQETPT